MAGKCSRLCYRAPAVTGTPGTKEAEVQASGNFMGGSDTPATMKWYENGISLANRVLSRFFFGSEIEVKPSLHAAAANLSAGTKLFVGNLPVDITEEALNYAGS